MLYSCMQKQEPSQQSNSQKVIDSSTVNKNISKQNKIEVVPYEPITRESVIKENEALRQQSNTELLNNHK